MEIKIKKIKAPWTTEQVIALNDYQWKGQFHEYTCKDSWHRPLAATHDGWICLDCDYTQDWAWDPLEMGLDGTLCE